MAKKARVATQRAMFRNERIKASSMVCREISEAPIGPTLIGRLARTRDYGRFMGTATAASSLLLGAGAPVADRSQEHAFPPPTYPPSIEEASLRGWIRKETDVRPAHVVAVSADELVAIMHPRPIAHGFEVSVRAEALRPNALAVASWSYTAQLDCDRRLARLGPTAGYRERNLLYVGVEIRPADAAWRPIEPTTSLEAVWRSACDPAFAAPLAELQPPAP